MIIKIKSNPFRIQFYFLVNLQTRDTMFKRKVFVKYMISLRAVARWQNLEAEMPHIKKYMSQNPEKF